MILLRLHLLFSVFFLAIDSLDQRVDTYAQSSAQSRSVSELIVHGKKLR